ncbi:LON peptidase substrate-binding domain-containing protein [Thalassotalea sp. G2M2-11]|uniref:LON peptidase substrate-binding domain-containing protein n=1 Tax=Thalassotalea sp. G2M2-11 TaxID=2787627 RepID=UPI0019D2D8B6|nr:LON peptidase substrate-binding domain-containing protein [Thalassotalea sp. G2M2-11]
MGDRFTLTSRISLHDVFNVFMMNIPLFPLTVFLLPQGITRLRIFEPKYLKMVSLAMKQQGFAIVYDNSKGDNEDYQWASWVDIIDFNQDNDGVLTIDVQCQSLVHLTNISTDEQQLRYADATPFRHWSGMKHDQVTRQLATSLQQMFEKQEELSGLYQNKFINSPCWVVSRWVELLPINYQVKQLFAEKNSYVEAKKLLARLILNAN